MLSDFVPLSSLTTPMRKKKGGDTLFILYYSTVTTITIKLVIINNINTFIPDVIYFKYSFIIIAKFIKVMISHIYVLIN